MRKFLAILFLVPFFYTAQVKDHYPSLLWKISGKGLKKPSYLYGGLNAWFEFSEYKAHNELQTRHVIPNLQLGYVLVKPKWQHQFEFKFIGMGIPNTPGVVEYVGLNGKGSFGFYYNLIRTF